MVARNKGKFSTAVILLEVIFLGLFCFFVRYDVDTGLPKKIRRANNTRRSFLLYPTNQTDHTDHTDHTNHTNHTDLDDHSDYMNRLNHFRHHEDLDGMLQDKPERHVEHYYSEFQDVHIIIFIGFGFLMTFLKRYGFSSVGFTLLIGAFAIQWQTLVHGWIDHFDDPLHEKVIRINVESMIKSDFAAAAILVSFGVVLGKTSPIQLIVMTLCEVVFFEANQKITFNMLKATDVGDSMIVHVFGAYFGLMVAWVLGRPDEEAEEKESSVYQSDLFSMIGTVFLWICWPSFNGATAWAEGRVRAIVNTYFSLTGSVVMAFAVSSLMDKKGKFKMEHIQNSSLAGGVAVGSIADLMIQPGGALMIGMLAGVVSVLGYKYISPFLNRHLKIHDTCGVHNLHGIPGIMSAVASVIVVLFATPQLYQSNHALIFGEEASNANQLALIQAACLGISLLFAIVGGVITGYLIRLSIFDPPLGHQQFDDEDFWIIPLNPSPHINSSLQLNPSHKSASASLLNVAL